MPAVDQAAAAAGITTAPSPPVKTHCPTITRTGTICQTCAVPDCILLSTIVNPCDCPHPVPTVTINHGCGTGCFGGCATSYQIAMSTTPCPTTTTITKSCEATVTVQSYPTRGCAHTCTSGFCILDSKILSPYLPPYYPTQVLLLAGERKRER